MQFSYYKDSGKGGQHRNKTLSGVRIQYNNIIVECCDTRDQRKNKEIAMIRLKDKLQSIETDKQVANMNDNRNSQNTNKGKRGNYTRNYNFIRNEVTQDGKKYKLKNIIKGNLDQIYN